MRRELLLVVALALHGSVLAQQTFQLAIDGTGTSVFFPNDPNCPGCANVSDFHWSGMVTIRTGGDADGVYSGADVLSFEVASLGIGFRGVGSQNQVPSVTLRDLQVVSVDGVGFANVPSFNPLASFAFSGLTARFSERRCFGCLDGTTATGTLSPIPEPSSPMMMLAGLTVLAISKKHLRSTRAQSG